MVIENNDIILSKVRSSFNQISTIGNNDAQLDEMLKLCKPDKGDQYLDLGTGSGYVAFRFAEMFPDSCVVGLDVVESVYMHNCRRVRNEQKKNIYFSCYDGENFPFGDNTMDGVVTRYALHHFPNILQTRDELNRILKAKSRIVICDCEPADVDQNGIFIDQWMRLLGDGHVHFYTSNELQNLLHPIGFKMKNLIQTSVICRRIMTEDYVKLAKKYPVEFQSYCPEYENDMILLKEPVGISIYERG